MGTAVSRDSNTRQPTRLANGISIGVGNAAKPKKSAVAAMRGKVPDNHELYPRSRRKKPGVAFIEKVALGRLLRLSDPAICVYVTLAKYANQSSGQAYPRDLLLLRELGFSPYFTDWRTGRTAQFLRKKQSNRRATHFANATRRLHAALQELCDAGLLKKSTRRNRQSEYRIYILLDASGSKRKIRFYRSGSFFMVPAIVFATGAFAVWKQRFKGKFGGDSLGLPLLLLALRDNDVQRFGGVDPSRLRLDDGALVCQDWPQELGRSEAECVDALTSLVQARILTPRSVVCSTYDWHMIRNLGPATAPDEMETTVFWVAGQVHVG